MEVLCLVSQDSLRNPSMVPVPIPPDSSITARVRLAESLEIAGFAHDGNAPQIRVIITARMKNKSFGNRDLPFTSGSLLSMSIAGGEVIARVGALVSAGIDA